MQNALHAQSNNGHSVFYDLCMHGVNVCSRQPYTHEKLRFLCPLPRVFSYTYMTLSIFLYGFWYEKIYIVVK